MCYNIRYEIFEIETVYDIQEDNDMKWRFWRARNSAILKTKKITTEEFEKLEKFEHFVPGCALFGSEDRALDEVWRTLKSLKVYCSKEGFDVFMNMVIMCGRHKEFIENVQKVLQEAGELGKREFYLIYGQRMYLCSRKMTIF